MKVATTDYLSSYQETISSSSANPITECLDCELNELDLNQDDDELILRGKFIYRP
ncbi:hypothetical protein RhiirA1_467183 [Rhizophagus irregularis]|uniref:Uncharacterized protein n=2 Tax=Rhizophagus irregularis TaxID=588596 RepID=A0A2N0RCI3_9GLOM|nr:hypothetical protein GLOIN_2v1790123 [Rhizophagus irregularis DAOM 181602=DAOM 197198]PKC61014.1 hypothetical protein RhiirA1_467183 [Rhizophagus irregularis]POG58637.1 hypothetical protein GLOIN_2v1790123 [Rhizophagus irregularis DAOM 181602=DAOM 197198]|eukprot:XP_025165503.1 hypothetical protein GLOIN_2v1790123 [Rhizophagus irregularis DAOM 181602=DAOM 197198]